MFISGSNCALRALEPYDADTLYKWENDRSLWSYSFTNTPFSRFVLEEFAQAAHQDIYANRQLRLMICDLSAQSAMGCVDLFDFDPQHNRCGLGIFVQSAFRGQGIAAESLALTLDYCFRTLLLQQVYVEVSEQNTSSLKLFEANGFQRCGLKLKWHRSTMNHYENVVMLQCLNPHS
jgi:diamine N-acetyltransferase